MHTCFMNCGSHGFCILLPGRIANNRSGFTNEEVFKRSTDVITDSMNHAAHGREYNLFFSIGMCFAPYLNTISGWQKAHGIRRRAAEILVRRKKT